MKFQYHPYVWLIIISCVITLFLGVYAITQRRNAKGATTFALTMMLMTAWSIIYILVFSSANLSARFFWDNVIYIPVGFTPILFLALSMEFTGYDDWIYSKKILWFTIWPVLFFFIKWTDLRYGLVYYDMHMEHFGTYMVLAKKYGPIYYLNIIYILLLNLASFTLLIRGLLFKNTVYRRQSLSLLAAFFIPHIPYAYFLYTKSSLLLPLDATILFFGPMGLTLAWGVFRLKLFDLVPVARATVVETMEAGVLVLDLQDRIIDINPTFQKMLGSPPSRAIGQDIEAVCFIPDLLAACLDQKTTELELSIESGEPIRYYQFLFSPLTDKHDRLIGRLVMSYDITEKRKAQQYHLQQQARLLVIEEQERIARDLHDNLGQLLAFISMQAQGVRQEFINAGVEIASHNLDKLVGLSQTAHDEVREYIQNARKLVLIEKDFMTALNNEISTFKKFCDIDITTDVSQQFTGQYLPPHTKVNIINIIKESLNNVVKHAGAQKVTVSINNEQDIVRISIEDDGQGFDISENSDSSQEKYGLRIMKERAEEIGANIDIQSDKEIGTCITFRVPLIV